MSVATTRGIRVEVRSEFWREQSSPNDNIYVFQYHVRIANDGSETAQLVSREWIITNADGEVEQVNGDGVIGKFPRLAAGEHFDYTSFCRLTTAVGSMRGTYQMVTESGERFDAEIGLFTLAVPNAVN